MSELEPQFDEFIEEVSLQKKQWDRIDSAFTALRDYLAASYSIEPEDVFIQGSCANGTAIKPPPDGDYA